MLLPPEMAPRLGTFDIEAGEEGYAERAVRRGEDLRALLKAHANGVPLEACLGDWHDVVDLDVVTTGENSWPEVRQPSPDAPRGHELIPSCWRA